MVYSIDIASRNLLFKIEHELLQGGIQIPGESHILVYDIDSLYIYGRNNLIWEHYFEDVDGIRNLRVADGYDLG